MLFGGYLYLRLDDEIRRHVEHRLTEHYGHLNVHVGSARFDQDRGITIYDLSIFEPQRDNTPQPLLSVDELFLSGNVRMEELLAGEPHVERIVIQRATLRAVRQRDGRWNIKTLLPLPKFSEQAPVLAIADATLVVEDATRPGASPFMMRGIDATFTPLESHANSGPDSENTPPSPRFRVEGTIAGAPARAVRFEGEMSAVDGSLDLTCNVNGLEVTPELLDTIPGGRPAELQSVQWQGRADLKVHVRRPASALAPLDWTANLTMASGRLEHPSLPQPITDLAVALEAGRNRLSVKHLTGKLGTADVTLALDRNGWEKNAPLGLAVRVTRLPLDERSRRLLPDAMIRLWNRFRPTGSVDAEARAAFDGARWSPQVTIACNDISLTDAERFPYQVEHANGKVEYRPAKGNQSDVLTFDLTGSGGGRPIHISGEFSQLVPGVAPKNIDAPRKSLERSVAFTTRKPVASATAPPVPARRPVGWVEIKGTDIPIHEELLDAMPDADERFVRSLRPQGTVDFRWRADWAPTAAIADITQEIQLKECSIQFERFRYPLHHINGLLTERNKRWTLHGIESRGANQSTVVVCHGESAPRENGRHIDLIFQATDVPLDESLREALSPEAQRGWTELQPQGRIDFTAHVVHEAGEMKPAVDVVVRPRDRSVTIEPRSFPYRFEQLDGEASFAGGRVDLRNVRARHGGINYSVGLGSWQPTAEGGWQLALQGVNGDRLRMHRDLLVALPPRMQKMLERLQPSGTFNLINSSLSFEKQARSDRISAAWDVWLDCHQAALHGGMPLENITGAVRLIGRDDDQSSYTAGELAIDSLIWKDLQFTNVRGPMWLDRSVCLFGRRATTKQGQPSRPVTADAYGGSLAADASLQHDGNTRYQIETAIGGADLNRFANERLGGPSQLRGTVSGRLSLEGAGNSSHALNGTGDLHIVDANIYELPVLVAMLKVLRNRPPDTTAFNQCDTQFTIQGEHVHFQQLNLIGDAVSLYGRGEANFDRDLNFVFYSLMGPADLPIPLWKNIVGQASEQMWQLKVDGTMDKPQIHRDALPAVNQVLDQIQSQLQAGAASMVPGQAFRNEAASKSR